MSKNVIFILTDSLNRHFLPIYGNDWVKTPNIDRLAARGVTFEQHYTGSAPCMPARRDIWTGCWEFPWRQWGSCEVFDEHVAALCARNRIPSHMVTDHYHYWERGGSWYLDQFDGCDFIRGHENDYFVSDPCLDLGSIPEPIRARGRNNAQHLRNIARLKQEKDYWSPQVFQGACDWLDRNAGHGPFFLVSECFDPHEPFNCPPPYDTMYGPHIDNETYWPSYGPADRYTSEQVQRVREFYAGKVTMLDAWLGRLLDRLDKHKLWDNTTVIFTTDHGHYLGEHNQLGKPASYPYQTLFHIPLIICEPGEAGGRRSAALSSHIDLNATVIDCLGLQRRRPGHGRSLLPVVRGETQKIRDWTIMGYWGGITGITDGRWKLHQAFVPGNQPLNAYGRDLVTAPFMTEVPIQPGVDAGDFMPHAGVPVLRQPAVATREMALDGKPSLLFDLANDPEELNDLSANQPDQVARLRDGLRSVLREIQAPAEQFARLGL